MTGAKPEIRVREAVPADEPAIVQLLSTALWQPAQTLDVWRAKMAGPPGFSRGIVLVAEHGDQIVGCMQTAICRVRLGPGMVVPASVDGDLAIRSDFRASGIAELLYRESNDRLFQQGVVLRLGYNHRPVVTAFYARTLGYVTGFDRTVAFCKSLSPEPIVGRLLARFGSTAEPARDLRGLRLEFRLVGLDPFSVLLCRGGVARAGGEAGRPAVTVEGDQRLIGILGGGPLSVVSLARLWRQGGYRVRCTPLGIVRFAGWYLRHGRTLMRRRA